MARVPARPSTSPLVAASSTGARGIEGAIPLRAGVATRPQAAAIYAKLIVRNEFATHYPFPAVSKNSPFFAPEEYWCGPVWLDRAYFSLKGLQGYGYNGDATALADRLRNSATGLLDNGPIMENYTRRQARL
ncbi:MGH1-like glycoside hydrolase domain-containing protein [Actinomadura decatromicini]|uniref:Mannosylglycerate hydrolase MGH1-like glycoside hydrolase domain-containing protein n=1 Tax=Actinomadura decatromicini TaxID=2604572 RepID=A0A5D3F4L0_9ACTN|nr:hypothetical protein [Actinomadura decatromicini]TYK43093.1 hypothetical protein FXF68_40145 [Actinomadura decatromicini]